MAKAEWARTSRLIREAAEVLRDAWPMTVRQLFYQLVSRKEISNDRAHYQIVSRIVTKAREDRRIPFQWIVDRSRPEYAPNAWSDLAGYTETVRKGYRKDYWAMQPNYVELWAEKDAVIGSIEDLTDKLGITVRVGHGFLSTTRAYEIAERFRHMEKPIRVFYLGDHDPSGRAIEEDARQRVLSYGSGPFRLRRLAILDSDIAKFKLPPLLVKPSDSRTLGFVAKHGVHCVELDALPVKELRRRIHKAVTALQDTEAWQRAVEVEQAEMASIEDALSRWPRSGGEVTA